MVKKSIMIRGLYLDNSFDIINKKTLIEISNIKEVSTWLPTSRPDLPHPKNIYPRCPLWPTPPMDPPHQH